MYDHLGGRKILPATQTLDLRVGPEGAPLQDRFEMGYEYSDCWVEDSRLVMLNARDAEARGAQILIRVRSFQPPGKAIYGISRQSRGNSLPTIWLTLVDRGSQIFC